MILLDRNVVPEPHRLFPDSRVMEWTDAQALDTLVLAAITVAELRAGVTLLPLGRRHGSLQQSLEAQVLPLFAGRVLPFDLGCTRAYEELIARAQPSGQALAAADGCIAAIAVANPMAVATQDIESFEAAGASGINPWQA